MSNNQKTILCCDDDEGILEVLQIIIEGFDINVVVTQEGLNLIDQIKELKPVAVFLDLWMPKINGEIIGKALKTDKETKHIPLVIVSANKELEDKAIEMGADYCIRKPFEIAEVERIIKAIIG